MRLLLDTHILLWWVMADRRLAKAARALIASADNDVSVSAASFWEIAIKASLGRIDVAIADVQEAAAADGFEELPIRAAHTLPLALLPDHHQDPFDRLLIAQAIAEGRRLMTADAAILAYQGVAGFDPIKA
ncbi:MAG: type II toxin-antitoxin system VapC family toxin [Acidobacteriota bacterium]